ncbi:MAG TPA: hypothetical protein VFV80_07540 [Geminicoccaceae bacterium]|nr:hypothetical protein [Geminicoccaceae bacterium]
MKRSLAPLAAMTFVAGAHAADKGITLAITSPGEATRFTATYTVTGPDGERTATYEQTTPLDLSFEAAKGLRCRVESEGALEVVAKGPDGNVSRSRTSGGTVTLALGG